MRKALTAAALALASVGFAVVGTASAGAEEPESAGEIIGSADTTDVAVRVLSGLEGLGNIDLAVALSQATADGSAEPRTTAAATNAHLQVGEHDVALPDIVSQAAPPDNPEPTSRALDLTDPLLSSLVQARLLEGSAQARWTDAICDTDPLSRATANTADVRVLPVTTLPDLLTGLEAPTDASALTELPETTSLLALPGTVSNSSAVTLVDAEGLEGKAVQSKSDFQLANLILLEGTEHEIQVRVVSAPSLAATSTGSADSSTIEYTAPVLEVVHAGETVGRISADNPELRVDLGGEELTTLTGGLDLGAITLSLGKLTEERDGAYVAGEAALLDLKVLGHDDSTLAQLVVGEQSVEAQAPQSGVICDQPGAPAPSPSAQEPAPTSPAPQPRPELANTNAQSNPMPYVLTGVGLLAAGGVIVAGLPLYRRRKAAQAGGTSQKS